jgi:hypothetical protein
MKIYVATSWRNEFQPMVVKALREAGHEVYDFRNPEKGDVGFAWSDVDPNLPFGTTGDVDDWGSAAKLEGYRDALAHPIAKAGFEKDMKAMIWAEVCVLVMPCGKSAHLEGGWFAGKGKPLIIFLTGPSEPELMYNMAMVTISLEETVHAVEVVEHYLNCHSDVDIAIENKGGLAIQVAQAVKDLPHSRTKRLTDDSIRGEDEC